MALSERPRTQAALHRTGQLIVPTLRNAKRGARTIGGAPNKLLDQRVRARNERILDGASVRLTEWDGDTSRQLPPASGPKRTTIQAITAFLAIIVGAVPAGQATLPLLALCAVVVMLARAPHTTSRRPTDDDTKPSKRERLKNAYARTVSACQAIMKGLAGTVALALTAQIIGTRFQWAEDHQALTLGLALAVWTLVTLPETPNNVALETQPSQKPKRPVQIHTHWIWAAYKLTGVAAAVLAVTYLPSIFAAAVIIIGHTVSIALRPEILWQIGAVIGTIETLGAVAIYAAGGSNLLAIALTAYVALLAFLTALAWRVNQQFIDTNGFFHGTKGLFLLKRTCTVELSAIRNVLVDGPWLSFGLITIDTPSSEDEVLHKFGPIANPDKWSGVVNRLKTEAKNKSDQID